jgi:hypothetical protein
MDYTFFRPDNVWRESCGSDGTTVDRVEKKREHDSGETCGSTRLGAVCDKLL